MIRALLVDDHEVFLNGLQSLLHAGSKVQVVGSSSTMSGAKSLYRTTRPDLLFIDLRMPDSRGVSEIAVFKEMNPKGRIVVLTGYGNAARQDALDAGADLFLTKDMRAEDIVGKVEQLFSQEPGSNGIWATLSPREYEAVRLASDGLTNAAIAETLGLSPSTIKAQLASAMFKLGVRDRISLAVLFARQH